MFSRLSNLFIVFFLGLMLMVSASPASPAVVKRTEPASSCSTGDLQCCNSVEPASSASATKILGLLGIVLQDLSVIVGLTCDPITVIGVGSDSCSAQAVCCDNNSFKGVIALGCTPVDLSL
ncbi:hydrophobin 2 [Auriscalpium vulgare]|uniref:Hydrophobin 2 n=1 Tax=Auriscalpium vulgare TaxID=40419 RepID=A0ACB8RW82_9AGAM|nr:hydrophobin 2 [Auriscalpium vulgare]